jgi:hypothetical protein
MIPYISAIIKKLYTTVRLAIPDHVRHILLLFIATRSALTLIGVASRVLLAPYHGHEFVWRYSKHLWLDIWAVWDAGWYLDISKNGYAMHLLSDLPKYVDPGQNSTGFFPLYPLLIAIIGFACKSHLVAGIIVSNICLLASAWLLYKLILLDFTEADSRRGVTYLFVFPPAFVLSAVYAESLFLFLSLLLWYLFRKKRFTGMFFTGIFMGLSRPTAMFVLPALLFAYCKDINFLWRKIDWKIFAFLGIPLGYILFSWYEFRLSGDWFCYEHIKQAAWGSVWSNPLSVLANCVTSRNISTLLNGMAIAGASVIVLVFYKYISLEYTLLGVSLLLLPMTAGSMVVPGMMRYASAVFPVLIACAIAGRNQSVNTFLTSLFLLLQGFLMVFWCNGFSLII